MDANTLFSQALGLGDQWNVVKSEMVAPQRQLRLKLDFPAGTKFAMEHLAASKRISGMLREIGWSVIRNGFRLINYVETRRTLDIWTRTFAFCCRKCKSSRI